jgi:phosphatidylserine/phosphatidylglycerophosphate/cardiolipin synthase-like enzyme
MADDRRASDLASEEITAALNQNIERNSSVAGARAGMRVMDAYLVPRTQNSTNPRQFFNVAVKVGTDSFGHLLVSVEDPKLSLQARKIATERLQRLIEDEPQSAFVAHLQTYANAILEPPASVTRQIDALERSLRNLDAAASLGNRQSTHDRLKYAAELVHEQLKAMASRQMGARLIRTTDEHKAELTGLLNGAKTQVVLAVPWINYDGLAPYLEAMRDAVRRGVRIILLWGIDRSESNLSSSVLNALADVEREARIAGTSGELRFERDIPSHTHAKLAIADDRRVLVTSKNFFSKSDLSEVGIVAWSDGAKPCPVAEEILLWTYQRLPSVALAATLITDRSHFGERSGHWNIELPSLPVLDGSLTTRNPDPASIRLWAEAWRSVTSQLMDVPNRLGPVIYLVADGTHRSSLWEALRNVSSRIVIASDQLSARVVTDDFIEQLRRCLVRGVNVSVLYRRAVSQQDIEAVKHLGELQEEFISSADGRGHFTFQHKITNHAKVLIADDTVIIGSYNFLSFEAQFGSGRRRQRSEISLEIVSAALASDLFRLVMGDHSLRIHHVVEDAPKPRGAYTFAQLALAELRKPAGAVDVGRVGQLCLSGQAEFDVNDALESAGIEDRLIDRALSAVFALSPQHGGGKVHWAEQLFVRVWRRGDWWLARLLRECLPEEVRPRLPLSRAAEGIKSPAGPDILSAAVIDDSATVSERIALSVLAATQYLHDGDSRLRDPMTFGLDLMPPSISRFLDCTLEHVAYFGPLPKEALRLAANESLNSHSAEKAWQGLSQSLFRFNQYNPNHPQSTTLKRWLLEPGGPFGKLEGLLANKNDASLVIWLAEHESDPQKFLNWAIRSACGAGQRIVDNRRKSFLAKIDAVLAAARAIDQGKTTAEVDMQWILAADRVKHIEKLRTEAEKLASELVELDDIEAILPIRLLHDLVSDIAGRPDE